MTGAPLLIRHATRRVQVMGVLNVTPDSFSDGGRFVSRDAAVAHAGAMAGEGADIIDVGGESTRPGAAPIGEAEELDRVIPVIEALRNRGACLISVDTSNPIVMRAAVAAGAGMINDVRALNRPGAVEVVSELGVPVCLVHMRGEPVTMQASPAYGDVVAEVSAFLAMRAAVCEATGIPRERILVDPGFGFGKNLAHNLALLRGLPEIARLGFPVVVGVSRKSLIGAITGQPVADRLHGSVALACFAALNGAAVVRVHDVGPTVQALRVIEAVMKGEPP